MYEYVVKEILKVYDGDTITVMLDLGFGVHKKEVIRLARINTPEIRGVEREDGLVSKEWLKDILTRTMLEDKLVIIKTNKDKRGKYGRYIGDVYIDTTDTISLNDEMVSLGLAEYVDY